MALTDPPKNVDFGNNNDFRDAMVTTGDIAGRDINKNITNQVGSQNIVSHSNMAIGNYIGRDLNQNTNHYAADERFNVGDLPCPYPGLESYTATNAQYFAGREELIKTWCQRLIQAGAEQTLLFVYGASGSGKSSFVRAGLVPALQKTYQEIWKNAVRSFYFTPNKMPKAELMRGLRAENIILSSDLSVQECFATLSAQTNQLTINILVIDQGEELFTQSNNTQCHDFLQALMALSSFNQFRTHIIVTFRADFLADLYQHQPLYQHVIKTGLDLRAMTADQITAAIQKPLQQPDYKGKSFVPLLVEELATVTAQQSSFLPLLQMTLVEIWSNGKLWLESKQFLHDALIKYADSILPTPSNHADFAERQRIREQRSLLLNLMTELVDINEVSKRDTRRHRRRDELLMVHPSAEQILNHLIKSRLLTITDQRDETGKPTAVVTIVHEILLQHWTPLQEVVETRREKAVHFKQFERVYSDWVAKQRNDQFLLSAGRIAQVQDLMRQSPKMFNSDHREFVQQSKYFLQQAERIRRRWRNSLMAILVILALIYPAILSYRWFLKQQAQSLNPHIPIPAGILQIKNGDLEPILVPMNAFQVDAYEVSNRQYQLCILASGCDEPQNPALFDINVRQYPDSPVANVTAFEAIRYCQWLDGSLPSSAEWEYTVRGSADRKYPWGDNEPTIITDFVNIDADLTLTRTLAPVDSYLKGATPIPNSVFNMLGNAMEWTSSDFNTLPLSSTPRWDGGFSTVPIQLSVRGSSFSSAWTKEVVNVRLQVIPSEVRRDLGFRCRYDS